MEELITKHGISGLVVILSVQLTFNVAKFAYKIFEEKRAGKEKETETKITKVDLTLQQFGDAVRELRVQIALLEAELKEVHKFKADSQKLFAAIKIMAGKRWPEVRKAMIEDAIPEKG